MGSVKDYYCAECARTGERMALVSGCQNSANGCPMRNKQDAPMSMDRPTAAEFVANLDSQPPDPTNPDHYRQGDVECIEAIKAALTPEEFRGFCKGNVIKYTWRERIKGKNESLAKARWYLNRLIGD